MLPKSNMTMYTHTCSNYKSARDAIPQQNKPVTFPYLFTTGCSILYLFTKAL